jgi:hypothetical protein
MELQDGIPTPEVREISKADRLWLEAAMNQYSFNKVDRLQ